MLSLQCKKVHCALSWRCQMFKKHYKGLEVSFLEYGNDVLSESYVVDDGDVGVGYEDIFGAKGAI